jgi:hypothetical protein
MAYIPTVWASGDVITAEKLNKAEEGIAAAAEVRILKDDPDIGGYTLSPDEVYELLKSGVSVAYANTDDGTIAAFFTLDNSKDGAVIAVFADGFDTGESGWVRLKLISGDGSAAGNSWTVTQKYIDFS